MGKKIKALLFVIILIVLSAACVHAADLSGKYENLEWTLKDGTLTVTGKGEITSDMFGGSLYHLYQGIEALNIGSGVTIENLSDIYGPFRRYLFNVKTIKAASNHPEYFSYDGVLFDKSKETLLACPCAKTGNYSAPKGIKKIGKGAFGMCFGITGIKVPEGVTEIGVSAFQYCKLKSVSLPESLETIGYYAFRECRNLTEITIPKKVTKIDDSCFGNCTSLKTVNFSEGVEYVDFFAFYGCSGLAAVNVDKNSVYFSSSDGVLFDKDKTELVMVPCTKKGKFTVPDTVNEIRYGAFLGCTKITSIVLPSGLEYIYSAIFMGCENLTSLSIDKNNSLYTVENGIIYNKSKTVLYAVAPGKEGYLNIPDGVISLDGMAFTGCNKITGIGIPQSLRGELIPLMFMAMPALQKIDVDEGNAWYSSHNGVLYNKDKTRLILFPFAKTGSYTLPKTVTKITDGAINTEAVKCIGYKQTGTVFNAKIKSDLIKYSTHGNRISIDADGTIHALSPGGTYAEMIIDGYHNYIQIFSAFRDVNNTAKYYFNPVMWAADSGITKGYTSGSKEGLFGVGENCKREDMIVFLWRNMGCPEPKNTKIPFKDVKAGKYYTNAILWAAENGITKGYDDGTFGVGKTVSREECVTFIYRIVGAPPVDAGTSKFTDVKTGKYYTKAIIWATENGITKGYDDGTFGIGKNCLREQIVTFIYRYENMYELKTM